jgi:transposase-like protein
VRVPVLVTLGVWADGRRLLLDLRMAGEESASVDTQNRPLMDS